MNSAIPDPVPRHHKPMVTGVADNPDAFLITGEGTEVVAPGVWILRGQGNSIVFELDAGLVIVDSGPGGRVTAGMIKALREVSRAPVHAVCFSHGHLGYNSGISQWLEHAHSRGEPVPRTIGHANLPRRVRRYRETMALQEQMAEVQFRREGGALRGKFPAPLPGETFEQSLLVGERSGRHIELLWAPSETDDCVAVWYPAQRILYGGPAVIDSIPNLGTPFRTQRDTVRWADTLDRMAALHPALLVREFGLPLVGEAEVQQVLQQTSQALRWIRNEVVRLLNQGMGERQMLDAIRFPPELFDVPWMKPSYGDPYWIARDVYRSENGWWDRNPTSLHPAAIDQASEAIAAAITDKQAILEQARGLAANGKTQLALHVVDLLATLACAGPEIEEARRLKAVWMRQRASESPSYVSKSIYHASAQMMEAGQLARFAIT
jgi:alkyl sulfatase BDS1-like metallo-beta-lactamase superfamily hydrolase